MTELSIIIPVYNEKNTIIKIIDKVLNLKNINKQVIVVDDFSLDGSREILIKSKRKIKLLLHSKNMGKGAAIRSAQQHIQGNYVIIQDADLEYSPNDYYPLLKFIKENNLKVLYGSRVLKRKLENKNNLKEKHKIQNFTHSIRIFANFILTAISNIINSQNLTDAHTCYKLFDSKIFKSIKLEENGFAFCPEITTKISNLKLNITELPINYAGRTYKEGKKIKFIHGIEAIYALFKYKFFK